MQFGSGGTCGERELVEVDRAHLKSTEIHHDRMTEPTGTRPRTRTVTRGPTCSERVVRPRCSYEKSRRIHSDDEESGEASGRLQGNER